MGVGKKIFRPAENPSLLGSAPGWIVTTAESAPTLGPRAGYFFFLPACGTPKVSAPLGSILARASGVGLPPNWR